MKKIKIFDELDHILIKAKQVKTNNSSDLGIIYEIVMSKTILEFAQYFRIIKYREMRAIISAQTKLKNLENEFIKEAEKYLLFKPNNWLFIPIYGMKDINHPKFDPQIFNEETGFSSGIEDLKVLLFENKIVLEKYQRFEDQFNQLSLLTLQINKWIYDELKKGTLELKISSYKNKLELKRKTNLSKSLVGNLINPSKAEIVKKDGDLPSLSLGERQALQFLLWKRENMTDRELHIKNSWILEGKKENSKESGYIVVFEKTEALKKTYGEHLNFDGWHYENLQISLKNLLEKKRRLYIEKKDETIELSITLLKGIEMKHKLNIEPDFRDYIVVWIPCDVADLHDGLYTQYPPDHFARLRNTPPKTRLNEIETRFFDFLYQEAPHNKKSKSVRRKKIEFLSLIGGDLVIENDHLSRLSQRVESEYAQKAINLGLLKSIEIQTNSDLEDVYIFEYADEKSLTRLFNSISTIRNS